ncbi:MAG: glycosyltransferase family 2 protein [Dethiobacter sp.]|nr:glycosyltransferase family 2 protein [Dethiobacter sp.]
MIDKNSSKKISILIPVFNRRQFISECIQSALNQTCENFEVVVVDNLSDDGTWEICQDFAKKDSRVRVFRNESNIGPVRNWIRCVEESRGEYGKFLFSDDLIFPDYLEKTLPLMSNPMVAFVFSAALIGEAPEASQLAYSSKKSSEIISKEIYFRRLASGIPAVPVSPGAALFRMEDIKRSLVLTVSGIDHDFNLNGAGPDVLLFALTAKNYQTVALISEPLVFFRAHQGSFSVENFNNKVTEGYRLALSWFFKNHTNSRCWADWTAKIMLQNIKNNWSPKSPFEVSRRYSGRGTWLEVVQMSSAAIAYTIKRLIK